MSRSQTKAIIKQVAILANQGLITEKIASFLLKDKKLISELQKKKLRQQLDVTYLKHAFQ